MKSGKQRRLEIKARRRKKAEQNDVDPYSLPLHLPQGAVRSDKAQLAHNNTYSLLPEFYIDKPFDCRDCGSKEVWTAKQQKWWYEIIKGHIDSVAVRCLKCRLHLKHKKNQQKEHMEKMAKVRPHPNEAFFKSYLSKPDASKSDLSKL